MTIRGIDVSDYQGSSFSTKGLGFVIVKATEGRSYINPKQSGQAKRARDAGCVVGFYHFLWPGNIAAQAKYFVEKCASVPGDLLACDWETTSDGTHASSAEKDQFLREVKKLRPDHRVLLYCNRSDWLTRDTTSFAGDGLWIADYRTAGRPLIQADWLIHQYTSSPLDKNIAAWSSTAAMRAWARGLLDDEAPAPGKTTPSKEPTVALTRDDIALLASADRIWRAPADASDYSDDPDSAGHYWSLGTHVSDQTTRIRAVQKTVTAMSATVQTLAGMVGSGVDTTAVVTAVENAIAEAVITVDVHGTTKED